MYIPVTDEEYQIAQNHNGIASKRRSYVDYMNKVCEKPWGHEFLVFQNSRIAIWFLKIKKGHSTSLHCHFKKDTLLTCISGTGKLTFFNDEVMSLPPLQSVFIPRNKFHALGTFSDETYYLEVEVFDQELTFSDKNDLLRINDVYQRDNTGYESSVQCLSDASSLAKYGYFHLMHETPYTINVQESQFTVFSDAHGQESSHDDLTKYIILQGNLYVDGVVLKEGSMCNGTHLARARVLDPLEHVRILEIRRTFANEDKKIIYDMEHLECIKKELQKQNKRVVLTSGCFDIIHVGHLHHLKEAKKLGDVLMVCLSNDEQIRRLKGESRPINNYLDRLNLFKTIQYVDYIVLYDERNIQTEETLGSIMKLMKPYVWSKGDDYTVEAILAKHPYLSKIGIIPNIRDKSTTLIIDAIMNKTI